MRQFETSDDIQSFARLWHPPALQTHSVVSIVMQLPTRGETTSLVYERSILLAINILVYAYIFVKGFCEARILQT